MLKIMNPATGALVREVEEDTAETLQKKFLAAKTAQKSWKNVSVEERCALLRKFREQLVSRQDELASLLTQEMGKPVTQSRNELKGVLPRIDFFLENTPKVLANHVANQVVYREPQEGSAILEEQIAHEPLGVVANISAWNYPYFVGSNVFVPALLTGNAVLYKPSEFATLTGLAIEEMMHAAGVPRDVFRAIIGPGQVGSLLLDVPWNGIFFTGSFATGRKIAEAASRRMVKMQLELGGKDPVYVCEDVDVIGTAAAVADGAFYNTGQSCCSVERVYVHSKIYRNFVDAFVKVVTSFQMGDPGLESTYIGPVTRGEHLGFLEKQLADAVSKGAQVLCGGKRRPGIGNFFEPTVLINVNHTMDVMREESFGPMIGIQEVRSDDEALSLMNDTQYGLTASVYTSSKERAERILSDVNVGTAYWNCCDRVSPRLPWTGREHSGIGATLSTYGIEAFLQLKAWHLKRQ